MSHYARVQLENIGHILTVLAFITPPLPLSSQFGDIIPMVIPKAKPKGHSQMQIKEHFNVTMGLWG